MIKFTTLIPIYVGYEIEVSGKKYKVVESVVNPAWTFNVTAILIPEGVYGYV